MIWLPNLEEVPQTQQTDEKEKYEKVFHELCFWRTTLFINFCMVVKYSNIFRLDSCRRISSFDILPGCFIVAILGIKKYQATHGI